MMVRVMSSGSVMPSPDTVPDTVTRSCGSGTSGSAGLSAIILIVTVPVLAVAFAANRSVRFELSLKSSSCAGP